MICVSILLAGCSVTIFRGNWRYSAQGEARVRMEAERVQPPQQLSKTKEIFDEH